MKLMKTGVMALFIMGVLGMGATQYVQACLENPDCYASYEVAYCGIPVGTPSSHTVVYPNGYTEKCTIWVTKSIHTIKCQGCGADLYTELRTCSEQHSDAHCFSQNNMCK